MTTPARILRRLAAEPGLAFKAMRRLVTHGPRATARMIAAVAGPPPAPVASPVALASPFPGAAPADLARRAREAEAAGGPLVSVVVPLHQTPPALLRACLASVRAQAYGRWELVLVDDASPSPGTSRLAFDAAARDRRIRTVVRGANGGVARATNTGLDLAQGDWTAFLDHDDELAPDALLQVAERLLAEPGLDAVYTDQVKIDAHGAVLGHHRKPDWSPALLLGVMYVGHLLVVRTALARSLGGFDPAYDGVQDYEFMLRLSERTEAVGHVAEPLYRWRAHPGSLAADADAKPGIEALQARAVRAHLARRGRSWEARPHTSPGLRHRVLILPGPGDPPPLVSVVIPSRDQGRAVERCLDSLHRTPAGAPFETVVVDDATTDPVALAAFARHPVQRLPLGEAFNFSRACNAGARRARGRLVLFLNNDTEVLEPGWLARLALWLDDPGVGAVGPVLLYPDRTVQHAGVVLGARGTADHVMRRFPAEVDGYAGSLAASREVSAVTGACLLMRRDEFRELGGFSADYARHYQDVDLCLRLRDRGRRIVCASRPRLIHHESLTRGADGYDMGDRAILIDRWRERLTAADPYYPAAFDRETLDYALRAA